ncbi:MAG: endopeptidase La [Deferribacteres bacterium]|nr:endopeptidase La [candidate division KSB1 bacterium]MCB9511667.1 endopeptidase La [Deferribacteres bacterium]
MLTINRDQEQIEVNSRLPILPLKDIVVFPYMIFPLLVGREPSLRAIQEAMLLDKMIFLTAQKDTSTEDPEREDLHRIGVVARILQILKLPNGLMKVLVEGLVRAKIVRFMPVSDHFEANIEIFNDVERDDLEIHASMRKAAGLFKEYVHLNASIPDEILLSIDSIDSPHRLSFYISAHIQREIAFKQSLLEALDINQQLLQLIELLESEKEILVLERDIDEKVRHRINKSQRNFYLQEQMRVIQEELGEDGSIDSDLYPLREKILKARMPEQAEKKALEELDKLKNMPPMAPESSVIRNYLDWLVAVPWRDATSDTIEIQKAREILDEDHFGLEEPKERILEHLAVLKLVKELKGPILCLVGPPGVGKTSLGKSVARAMGRKFVRISLGGVRDEAEIRGHRRTYIGSMPGRIIQSMKKAKSINPVFLLDEIDKMSVDFRGDPSSALLEVLDPEQNKAFNDHYLEVDYDLSKVLFITTANVRSQIPEPLQDRMEVISLPGYLEHEKVQIATNFLIPKLLEQHGLDDKKVTFMQPAILRLIREYTREAGVRNLERELSAICRKIAKDIATNGKRKKSYKITASKVESLIDMPKFPERRRLSETRVGLAVGLAWTKYGGDILEIEVTILRGKGELKLTGKLGEVMKESAHAAMSYIRHKVNELGITAEFWKDNDIHVHIPEGAIPKDGPSAGITIATALISALTEKAVRPSLAMTGEITLAGRVLAIGGLNEKMLAAQRFGVKTVIVPNENENELKKLPPELKKGLEIIRVKHIDEVLDIVFNGQNK